jgi:hypothetical protein
MRFLIYLSIGLAMSLGSTVTPAEQISHGTFVAGIMKETFLLVGAESGAVAVDLDNTTKRIIRDDLCTIRVLGNDAIFAVSGLGGFTIDRIGFDPLNIATRAYSSSGGDISRAASLWADEVKAVVDPLVARHATYPWQNALGHFYTFDAEWHAHTRTVRVGQQIQSNDYRWPSTEATWSGDTDLVQAFMRSSEAQAIQTGKDTPELERMGKLLYRTIESVVSGKHARSIDDVGGPIAVVALVRGQRPYWLYHSPKCDQENPS